jgi:hypothetical protein
MSFNEKVMFKGDVPIMNNQKIGISISHWQIQEAYKSQSGQE